MRKIDIRKNVIIALFCAIAYLFVFLFKFNVGFLTFDLKDAVITTAAMLFGPVAGVIISLIVALLEMITISGTGFYGFLMNFISSAVFSATAALLYRRKKDAGGAIIALFTSCVTMTSVMLLANLFITPLYMTATTTEDVVKMIPKLLLPFNTVKSLMNMALVLIIYKPISRVMKRYMVIKPDKATGAESGEVVLVENIGNNIPDTDASSKRADIIRSVIMLATAALIIVISICIFIFVLDGKVFIKNIFTNIFNPGGYTK